MDFYDVVKNRKSIRKYTTQKIPEDVLQRVLEAARWAPSWGNKQCWRYIVVDDPAVMPNIVTGVAKSFNAPMFIVSMRGPGTVGA